MTEPIVANIETADGTELVPPRRVARLSVGDGLAIDASDVCWRVVRVDDGEPSTIVVEVDLDATATSRLVPVRTTHTLASTNGVELAVHHFGGDGPTMLICHATGFHALAYAPFVRPLIDHFDVWAVDMRGHGAATPPDDGDFAWAGMATDVATVIKALDLGPVVGVGHSMGGASILAAEAESPGTFTAAYLFEPIVFSPQWSDNGRENPMSGPARRRRPEFDSRAAVYERYSSRPPLSFLSPDALAAYVQHGFVDTDHGTVRLACEPEHEARTFEAEDKMTFERLDAVGVPLVVAAGQFEEGGGPADSSPEVAARVTGARFSQHLDLGHFGPLENPAVVAREVIAWLVNGDEVGVPGGVSPSD